MNQEELKVIISANSDKLRQEFKKVQQDVKNQADKIDRTFDNLSPSLNRSANASRQLASSINVAVNNARNLTNSLNNTDRAANNASNKVNNLRNNLNNINDVDINVNENRSQSTTTSTIPTILGAGLGAGIGASMRENVSSGISSGVRDASMNIPEMNWNRITTPLKAALKDASKVINSAFNDDIQFLREEFKTIAYPMSSEFSKYVSKIKKELASLGQINPLSSYKTGRFGDQSILIKNQSRKQEKQMAMDSGDLDSYREHYKLTNQISRAYQGLKANIASIRVTTGSYAGVLKVVGINAKTAFNTGLYNSIYKARLGIDALYKRIPGLDASIKKLKINFKGLSDIVKTGFKNLTGFAKTQKAIKDVNNEAKKATKSMGSLKQMLLSFGLVGAVAGSFRYLKAAIMDGMADGEVDNVYRTAFNGMLDDMDNFVSNSINKFGMTEQAVKDLSASFMLMTSNMTGSKETGLEMSKSLTQMAIDFASFYNVSTEQARTLLSQGMSGETEGLKRYGIMMNETNVKNYAYANGIANIGEELTESQKTMARYGTMMQQMSQAHGDFASTINSPANQLRILQAQLAQTKIELGKAFQPILSIILPILNNLVSGLNTVISSFALFMEALFGVKMSIGGSGGGSARMASDMSRMAASTGNAADGMRDLGKSASDTVKEFKGLMGFDEINLLPSTESGSGSGSGGSGGSGSGGSGGGSVELPSLSWETADKPETTIPPHIQALADAVKDIANGLFEPIKAAWDNVAPRLITEIRTAWDNIKGIFTQAKETIASIWRNGGSDIFQGLIDIVLEVGVIAGRVFNETLVPIVSGFLDLLNPEKNSWAQGFLDGVKNVTDSVKGFVEYLAGDGFYWVDWFVKAFLTFKAASFVIEMAKAVKAVISLVLAYGALFLAKMVDYGQTLAIIGLYVKDFIVAIAGVITAMWGYVSAAVSAALASLGITWPVWLVVAAIAAVIAIIVVCIKHWDAIKASAKACWDAISKWVVETKNKIVEKFYNIGQWFSEKLAAVKQGFNDWKNNVATKASEAWDNFTKPFKSAYSWFKTNVVDKVTSAFSCIVGNVKGAFNSVISSVNWAIGKINNAMSFSIPSWVPLVGGKSFALNIPKVPMLAKGGIVDGATMAVIGEAGKEAVMPLENNTGWITDLAGKITNEMGGGNNNQPIEVTIELDGQKLGKCMINKINSLQRQSGKPLIEMW